MCPTFHQEIRKYAEGKLQGEAKRRLELHFALCEGCLREFTRMTGRRVEQPVLGFESLEMEPEYLYGNRVGNRRQTNSDHRSFDRAALLGGAAGLLIAYLLASHSLDAATGGRSTGLLYQAAQWLRSLSW